MGVIIHKVKPFLVALATCVVCLSVAQQVPVTRKEFSVLFAQIAASLDVSEVERKGLFPFPLDEEAIDKSEVALAMLAAAKSLGKSVGESPNPLERLKNAKFLPEGSAIFNSPGMHFRPADLVKALVAFVDGMTGKPEYRSADEAMLTPPRSGHGGE
jgi:hypothetical protein